MTNKTEHIDPDLWQVLIDVAGEERAPRLFAPMNANLERAWRREPAVNASSSLLSKAERHLARFHREEIALLLRKACALDLASDAAWSDVFVPARPVDERLTLPHRTECATRVELVRRRSSDDICETEAFELLSTAVGERAGGTHDVVRMATLSEVLVPSDTARVYVAMDLWRQRQLHSARRILRALIAQPTAAELEGYARQSLSLIEWELDNAESALMNARRAASPDEPRAVRFLLWFALCLHLELKDEAIVAARGIDERIKPDHPLIAWFAGCRTAERLRTTRNSSARRSIQRVLVDTVGPASNRIIHAIS